MTDENRLILHKLLQYNFLRMASEVGDHRHDVAAEGADSDENEGLPQGVGSETRDHSNVALENVTKNDMIDFIAERCTPEMEEKIREQLLDPNSFASRFARAWDEDLKKAFEDVDLARLFDIGNGNLHK